MEKEQLQYRIENSGFGAFLKSVHPGVKLQKISINAGHNCPNRDGSIGKGGCTFCVNASFAPDYTLRQVSIEQQVEEGIAFFRKKYPETRYLAYFQAYTSTHASLEIILEQYRVALKHPLVDGLVISTRPDCMPEELLEALSLLAQEYLIIVEYGVESTKNETLQLINRGHSFETAAETIRRTASKNLWVGVHLILGLPGENLSDYTDHAQKLSKLPIHLVKLHQLQILKGSAMERSYRETPSLFSIPSPQEYARHCIHFVRHLRQDIFLDRFTSQSPPDMVIVPEWKIKNFEFRHILLKELQTMPKR